MRNLIYIFTFLLFGSSVSAQVLFTAEASRYEVAVGETFGITFTLNANAQRFDFPSFENFRVASGPMTGVSHTNMNGKRSVEQTAQFQVIALKKGKYTIGAAKVKVGNEVYQTKPITINVVDQSQKKPTTAETRAAEMAYVKVQTNKRKIYLGEPISARYVLVLKTNIGQFEYLEQPEFTGFVKNDIPIKSITTKKEEIDGQTLTTADLAKFVLIPQQAGTFKPGKLQLRIPTGVPTGRRDWFGQQEMATVNQISTSTFPTIEVLPLPTQGKPANFSGGVGTFKLDVSLSRNQVKGGESITLKVEVSGRGNIQLIDLPELEIPNSIEKYEPKYTEKIDVLPNGVKGYKRNEILLIPQYKGVYKIPSISFSYFDSDREKYVTQTTEEMLIDVTEGETAKNYPGISAPATGDKNAVSAIGEDILFIHTKPSEFQKSGASFFMSTLHWSLVLGLILITFGLFVWHRLRKNYRPDVVAKARKNAGGIAKKRLKIAHEKLQANAVNEFYSELMNALQKYFQDKTNLPPSDFGEERIAEIIHRKKGSAQLAKNMAHLLKQANMARFAPLTQANMQADYNLAAESLERLEELL